MAKGMRGRRGIASRQCRSTPYPLPSCDQTETTDHKNCSRIVVKDWKDAKCSVCMECPHNAVLLLCASHDKGCHPYMCGTSFRYSNCLDQYKKAYSKEVSFEITSHESLDNPIAGSPPSIGYVKNCENVELSCPLCRGQVKGWTVVEPAREYFNAKKRNCMQDNCLFIGTYKELRKHMKADHPSAKPREVDPTVEKKWNRMEREREREDVISTIRSSMPGAVFFGDYVIEGNHYGSDSDDRGFDVDILEQNEDLEVGVDRNFMSLFLFLQAFGSAGNAGSNRVATRQHERDSNHAITRGVRRLNRDRTISVFDSSDHEHGDGDENDNDGSIGMPRASRMRRYRGNLSGRLDRRRRRENNGVS